MVKSHCRKKKLQCKRKTTRVEKKKLQCKRKTKIEKKFSGMI